MQFTTEYWTESESHVEFIPTEVFNESLYISGVKIYVTEGDQLLLTRVSRGWDLPGGHVEEGETPEETLIRELQEETGGSVKSSRFIGYLRITNTKENDYNRRYPKVSCILIYAGSDLQLKDEALVFEATERKLIPFSELTSYHHNWTKLKQQILDYIVDYDKISEIIV